MSVRSLGLIALAGARPLVLLPVDGVIAEAVDRRRALLAGQLVGGSYQRGRLAYRRVDGDAAQRPVLVQTLIPS